MRYAIALVLLAPACANDLDDTTDLEDEPIDERDNIDQQGIYDCSERSDTGYRNGSPFSIRVVTVDGRPVERDTANAYIVMQSAAARDGVGVRIVSGFRTMSEQQYLYHCYQTGSCNNGNLAARPGYSNHQSGHALDLNTSDGAVRSWLANHGGAYGFSRTVPSEAWHFEWWGGGPGGGPCGAAPPPPPCESHAGDLAWNCAGPIPGMACTQVIEPSDNHTWNDNWFCSKASLGARWSYAGPIAGMKCTQITEGADPDTWDDNFLCVHEDAPYDFTWSSAGPVAGKQCLQWNEPADPHTWNDNFLCFDAPSCVDRTADGVNDFAFSCAGPVAGMACTQLLEGADPDTWNDNYLCSASDIGLQWSSAGPIAGADCTQIAEGADPHTWDDNYVCFE